MTPDYYHTIQKKATAEFKDRGSHFISYVFALTDAGEFKGHLATIKKEHPKATHHCFAYRVGVEGNIYRSSDDGEPSGTAGRPILGQIDSRQLTDVLVIVVRYFGGTQLGVPGLINAYKTAATLALDLAGNVRKVILAWHRLQFDYSRMNDVMTILKQFGCEVKKRDDQLFCLVDAGIPKDRLQDCLIRLKEINRLEIEPGGT